MVLILLYISILGLKPNLIHSLYNAINGVANDFYLNIFNYEFKKSICKNFQYSIFITFVSLIWFSWITYPNQNINMKKLVLPFTILCSLFTAHCFGQNSENITLSDIGIIDTGCTMSHILWKNYINWENYLDKVEIQRAHDAIGGAKVLAGQRFRHWRCCGRWTRLCAWTRTNSMASRRRPLCRRWLRRLVLP